MKYRYTKTLLLFLVLGTCGVVGLSVRGHGRVLQHVGVMSALSFMVNFYLLTCYYDIVRRYVV